jgi:hypothetical protein
VRIRVERRKIGLTIAQIMDLKVPRSTLFGERRVLFSGVLATGRGVTYVVLLRDGVELEGYRVP